MALGESEIHVGRESDFRVSFSLFTFGHSKFAVAKSEIYGHFTFGEGQKVKSRPFTFGAPEAVKSVFCLAWRCGVWTTLASSDQSRGVKCSWNIMPVLFVSFLCEWRHYFPKYEANMHILWTDEDGDNISRTFYVVTLVWGCIHGQEHTHPHRKQVSLWRLANYSKYSKIIALFTFLLWISTGQKWFLAKWKFYFRAAFYFSRPLWISL